MTQLLVLLANLLFSGSSQPGLIVMEYQAKGILDKAILRDVWDRTHQLTTRHLPGQTVGAEETRKRIFDQSVLVPARCDQACNTRLGTKLHAKTLLMPSIEKTGDQLKVSFQLVDVKSGDVLSQSFAWSDGRIGQAIESALSEVLKGAGSGSSGAGVSGRALGAAAMIGAGVGAVLWLGLDAPAVEPVATQPVVEDPITDVVL
ncbi:MAG: hypothetical protein H6686_02445 [Fibrobacteria bacterium]|nr:hypothetical protein [Fibrobacteria bacterium]